MMNGRKSLPQKDALAALVRLFDFAASARAVDRRIAENHPAFKGHPRPARCASPRGDGGVCNLPLQAGAALCRYHGAVHEFGALKLAPADIHEHSPKEAEIRRRLAALQAT